MEFVVAVVSPVPLAFVLLERVRWDGLEDAAGPARGVPQAVQRFMTAETPELADAAYWDLDNRIVVQQNIFPAAVELTPVLLAMLADDLPPFIHVLVLELLYEIGNNNGIPWTDGNSQYRELRKSADNAVCAGDWLYVQKAGSGDPSVQDAAEGLIGLVDRLRGGDTGTPRSLVDIDDLVTAHRWSSERIPHAVRGLATATTEAVAAQCERALAGEDSATLARVLLSLLARRSAAPVKAAACRLLGSMVRDESRAVVRGGMWLFYQGLLSEDAEVRAASTTLLKAVEPDRDRLDDVLSRDLVRLRRC